MKFRIDNLKQRPAPNGSRNVLASINMVVVFVIHVTRGATVVVAWCPLMQPGCYWKFFPAKFGEKRTMSWKLSVDDSKVGPINIVKNFLMPMEP
jgi:hypothetical protein